MSSFDNVIKSACNKCFVGCVPPTKCALKVEIEKLKTQLQELVENSGRMLDFNKEPCVIIPYQKLQKLLGCVEK